MVCLFYMLWCVCDEVGFVGISVCVCVVLVMCNYWLLV